MVAVAQTSAFDTSFALTRGLLAALESEPKRRTNIALLRDIGRHVGIVVDWAEFLLGVDRRTVAMVRDADREKIARDVLKRTESVQFLVTARPVFTKRAPKLRTFWADTVHRRAEALVVDSVRFTLAIEQNEIAPLPPDSLDAAKLRFAPLVLEEAPREIADAVVEFCERHGLTTAVLTASQIAWDTFAGASEFNLSVERDLEGADEWVTINLRVPDQDTLSRFDTYLARVTAEVASDAVPKIDLRYDIV